MLVGHAYDSEGMPPYLPFNEALREYVRAAPLEDLRVQLDEAGPDVALLAPDIRRRLSDIAATPPSAPGEQRYRLFESISDSSSAFRGARKLAASSSSSTTSIGLINPQSSCFSISLVGT